MVLGICGSLRAKSLNRICLQALQAKLPDLEIWEDIGNMPLFNPDLPDNFSPVVIEFRKLLKEATAIVIASPEYAHGVTGVLKNALDWVVGTELSGKRTVVINCSHSSTIANLALRETLSVTEAIVFPFSLPLYSHGTTVETILGDPNLSRTLDEIVKVV